MFSNELSELLEEIREIEIYGNNPQNWMGCLSYDDYYVTEEELSHGALQTHLDAL
jgi:hypothetical protein